jgi:hypothetical protein
LAEEACEFRTVEKANATAATSSLLHRPEECAILQQPLGVDVRPIFDNQHSAVSAQHSAKQFATLCRPNSKNEKTGRKLTAIEALKNVKMRGRQAFDRPFELGLNLCFQQNVQGGGVCG